MHVQPVTQPATNIEQTTCCWRTVTNYRSRVTTLTRCLVNHFSFHHYQAPHNQSEKPDTSWNTPWHPHTTSHSHPEELSLSLLSQRLLQNYHSLFYVLLIFHQNVFGFFSPFLFLLLLLPSPFSGGTHKITVFRSKPTGQHGPREAKANRLPLQQPSPFPSYQAFYLRPAINPSFDLAARLRSEKPGQHSQPGAWH